MRAGVADWRRSTKPRAATEVRWLRGRCADPIPHRRPTGSALRGLLPGGPMCEEHSWTPSATRPTASTRTASCKFCTPISTAARTSKTARPPRALITIVGRQRPDSSRQKARPDRRSRSHAHQQRANPAEQDGRVARLMPAAVESRSRPHLIRLVRVRRSVCGARAGAIDVIALFKAKKSRGSVSHFGSGHRALCDPASAPREALVDHAKQFNMEPPTSWCKDRNSIV